MPKASARLLSLLSLLQARRDWPGPLLAVRLDISPRTVRRDVERLRELGYRITAVKGPDGGYRLEPGSHLPPLLFDDEQVVALTVGLQLVAASGLGLGEASIRALHTVRQVMPTRLHPRIDTLAVTAIDVSAGGPDLRVPSEVLMTLGAAIRACEELRFDYRSTSSTSPSGVRDDGGWAAPRRVQPHHLVTRGGRWFLLGWDVDRAAWRTFRVDRIWPRTPNGPRFTPREVPGANVAAFVTGSFRGAEIVGGGWPCTGAVILALPAAEVIPFAGDGMVEPLGPDRCRLTAGSWSWASLAAVIGRFDVDFQVVGPSELRDAVAHLAARYVRASSLLHP